MVGRLGPVHNHGAKPQQACAFERQSRQRTVRLSGSNHVHPSDDNRRRHRQWIKYHQRNEQQLHKSLRQHVDELSKSATGFPGSAGTLYIVAVVQQVQDQAAPVLFEVRTDEYRAKQINLNAGDTYHAYFYPNVQINNIGFSRHGVESYNWYTDDIPHIWKITWDATSGVATFELDGHHLPSNNNQTSVASGYQDFGSVTFAGIEVNTSTWNAASGTWQFCEMTLHNQAIPLGSADDVAMINYLRNKWRTAGYPVGTSTVVRQADLSGGGFISSVAIANDGTLLTTQDGPNCWRWDNKLQPSYTAAFPQFDNLFEQTRLPPAYRTWGGQPLVALDIAIAPSDSGRIYVVVRAATASMGEVWRSSDSGQSWVNLAYTLAFAARATR